MPSRSTEVVGVFGLVEVARFAAAAGDFGAVLAARVLDFTVDGLPALRALPEALAGVARPDAAPLGFFRIFWDIRLPFVAFSGASRESGE